LTHAAESLHWYDRSGRPAYTVKAKDGSDRPATLRDARKLNLVPSVTAIIKCAAAPGLQYWMQKQVMLAALTLPKVAGETEDAYLSRILNDSKEQARKAAERGTAIHAAIQGFYQDETTTPGYEAHIEGAVHAVQQWAGEGTEGQWIAEAAFAHQMGFGGKVDLHVPGDVVVDFKTKEFDTTADLKTWDEHHMQLAAYRHGLGLEKAHCAIVYVSTTVPGLAKLIEIPEEELQRGWTCFYSLLHFWQAKSSYRSAFSLEPA
jgi:hypothetical protein